jgi:predicted small metal-binding protein
MNCDTVIRANTEDELMKQAAAHAKKDHGLDRIDDALAKKVKSVIRTV